MITTIEAIKGIIRQHDLSFIIVMNMDRVKQHQADGGPENCCRALDECAVLLAAEPFRVHAFEKMMTDGGKRPKLAKDFEWIVRPDRAQSAAPMPYPSNGNADVMAALNGIAARLTALETGEDPDGEDPEPAPAPEPRWLEPAMARAFALVDRFLGLQGQPAINGGSPGAAAPVPEDELLRAVLRANKDPQNAQFAAMLVAQYGDKAAEANPAKP